jgi:integral membrane sensor domain MASE1
VGVLYAAAAFLGVAFNKEAGLAAPLWLANAILVVALLRAPVRDWIGLVAAAALGLTLADLVRTQFGLAPAPPPQISSIYIVADMVESLVAATLLRWGRPRFELAERDDAVRFILTCGLAAPLVSTLVSASSNLVVPGGFGVRTAQTWFTSNALGLLIFTPALWLTAGSHRNIGRDPARWALFLALICALAAVMAGAAVAPRLSLPLLALPILAYLAFEFGVAGAAIGMLATAVFAVAAAVSSPYLDPHNPSLRTVLYAMQIFLASASVMVLALGVIADDKKRIQDTLINLLAGEIARPEAPPAREEAEITAALVDRTGRLRLIAGEAANDPALKTLEGAALTELVEPAQRRALSAMIDAAFAGGGVSRARRLRTRVRLDGDWHSVALTVLSASHDEADGRALLLMESVAAPESSDPVAQAA